MVTNYKLKKRIASFPFLTIYRCDFQLGIWTMESHMCRQAFYPAIIIDHLTYNRIFSLSQ